MVSFSIGTSSSKSPLEKEIIEATSKDLADDPWDKIISITDKINNEAASKSEICSIVASCISKRIQDNTNANVLNRTLTLLLSIGENCGSRMKQEISSRDFTDCLKKYLIDNRNVHYSIKKRTVEVLYQLSQSFKNDPSLRLLEDLLNYMVYKYPEFIPDSLKIQLQGAGPSKSSSSHNSNKLNNPSVPRKKDLSTKELQNEEKELQLALKLSLEEYKSSQKQHNDIIATANQSRSNQPTVISGSNQETVIDDLSSAETRSQVQFRSEFQDESVSNSHAPSIPASRTAQKSYEEIIREHQAVNPNISVAELDQFIKQTPTNNLKVRALFTHKSSEPDELSFEKNDVITVTESVYKDWWRGSLKGEVGIFPLNYVKPYNEEDEKIEILKDLEMENQIIQQSKNIDRLLLRLQASNASDNLQQISDTINDDMVQSLYTQLVSLRPYVAKLIKKYSSKKDELISLNSKLNDAQGKYNVLMNNYISGYDQSQIPVMPTPQQQPIQPILQQQASNSEIPLATPVSSQYTNPLQSQMLPSQPIAQQQTLNSRNSMTDPVSPQYTNPSQNQMPSSQPIVQQQTLNSRNSMMDPVSPQYTDPSQNQMPSSQPIAQQQTFGSPQQNQPFTANPFKHQSQEERMSNSIVSDLQSVHISSQSPLNQNLNELEEQKHVLPSSVEIASQHENISQVGKIAPVPTTQFSQHSIPASVLEQLRNSKNTLSQQQPVVNSIPVPVAPNNASTSNSTLTAPPYPVFDQGILPDFTGSIPSDHSLPQQLPQAPQQQFSQSQQQLHQHPSQTTGLARHGSSVLSGASPFPSDTSGLLPKAQPSLEH